MNKNLTSNTIDNSEFNLDSKDSDYQNLITRLEEITKTIALLKKTIFI